LALLLSLQQTAFTAGKQQQKGEILLIPYSDISQPTGFVDFRIAKKSTKNQQLKKSFSRTIFPDYYLKQN
jgi:hypothetical protein